LIKIMGDLNIFLCFIHLKNLIYILIIVMITNYSILVFVIKKYSMLVTKIRMLFMNDTWQSRDNEGSMIRRIERWIVCTIYYYKHIYWTFMWYPTVIYFRMRLPNSMCWFKNIVSHLICMWLLIIQCIDIIYGPE
jgi:hypothetical protein